MRPPALELRAHAKLNLFLEVLFRREDGYHELETVMQAIDLHDDVVLEITDRPGIVLERQGLPIDVPPERDLCVRAAASFFGAADREPHVAISLFKRIPPGSGMGGGSSDAAQVLRGLNTLHGSPLGVDEIQALASHIGSDVSFFLRGGRALCHGRGERMTSLNDAPKLVFVVHVPPVNCPTSLVYSNLHLTGQTASVKPLLAAIATGEVEALQRELFNRLEPVALSVAPTLRAVKAKLDAVSPVPFRVTGSGSGFYRVVQNLQEGTRLRAALGASDPGLTFVTESVAGWA